MRTCNWPDIAETANESSMDPAERVCRGIVEALYSGTMVPGQRLIENELAERFASGRSYVREALQRLENDGVISIVPFRGARVREFSAKEVNNINLIQASLFALAARHAADRIGDTGNLAILDSAMADVEEYDEKAPVLEYVMARDRFLRLVIRLSGIDEIERVCPIMQSQLIRRQLWMRYGRAVHERRLVYFRAIHEAIRKGDGDAAEKAVWASNAALSAEAFEAPETNRP
jgi:DNA-binding GntR family transcriptional regulator